MRLSQSGWLILTVPANLVRGAYDALHEQGLELPEEYSIAVMSPTELNQVNPNKITERGHSFSYTLGPVRSNEPSSSTISKVWYIQIYSQELKKLRRSYKLEPNFQGHYFFKLPIAVRKVIPRIDKSATDQYLLEPDWDIYDYESVKQASEGRVFE
jgi:hypothetical protein